MTTITINPATAKFSWIDPTTNTDGAVFTPSEVTGFTIGIGTSTGVYPILIPVSGAVASQEALSAIGQTLAPNTYFAAVRTAGPVVSAWSNEVSFTIAPSTPSNPTNFQVA